MWSNTIIIQGVAGGGILTCQRYRGMCRFDDPLFRLLRCSRYPRFLHLVSVLMPSVFCFLKNSSFLGSFLSDLGKISASNTLILAKICSQNPSFLRKNLFCRPYYWKPVRHIQKKCPPRGVAKLYALAWSSGGEYSDLVWTGVCCLSLETP